jgi:ADP-ribose pyrophosphatase YjhB (NUDIX family)
MADGYPYDKRASDGKGYMHGLAIDAVIFGFHNRQLKVLLLEYSLAGIFALPGGFIREKENVNGAALRVVRERTGLHNIFLDQFYVFGDYNRFDNRPLKAIMQAGGTPFDESHWLLQRFITIGYYALVDFTKAVPMPDQESDICWWCDLDKIPTLIQDHAEIIAKARSTLQDNLDKKLIGFNLLPEHFTMAELQAVYETILGKKILRPVFQRKMLGLGILERLTKKHSGGAHKAPYLYRFAKTVGL